MLKVTPHLSQAWRPLSSRAWKPLAFPNKGFTPIPAGQKVEEETLPDYVASRYYPVRIGEILRDRYQIVGKLGYGATSTVWLARDLRGCRHVALKLFIHSESMGSELDAELDVYERIAGSSERHPGRTAVRPLLDSFDVAGPKGRRRRQQHRCLVHPPLWESVLKRLFHALALLHEECRVAHTDVEEANLLLGADESVLGAFEEGEMEEPGPRKELDGGATTVHLSRALGTPEAFGAPVLCDLGSAVPLDDGREHREDIQPDVYRAPEVILDVPWSYGVDIWNVGCVVWDAFQGQRLFTGRDPELGAYRSRAHLAEMIALLGPPPPSLLARANLRGKFFSDAGDFCAGIPLPKPTPLEDRETTLAGAGGEEEDRELFLRLMRKMLQWEPEKRGGAASLAEDAWIVKHTTD